MGSRFSWGIFAGPPQGVAQLPDFTGLNAILATSHDPALWTLAVVQIVGLGLGVAVVGLALINVLRHREFSLLLAFASILVLPVMLHAQYAYVKSMSCFHSSWRLP